MQLVIIDQFRNNSLHEEPFNTLSLIGEFINRMTTAATLIFARMRKPPYTTHWLYNKPESHLLQNPDRHNWTTALQILLNSSILLDDPGPTIPTEFINLTSELQPPSSDSD